MAIIPTAGAGQPIDRRTREANISVGQAGLVGDALSKLGTQVMESALQYEHQRRNGEAQSYALEKSVETEAEVQRYALEEKAKRIDGKPDPDYAERVRIKANDLFRAAQDQAPTDLARGVFQQRSEADLNRYALHAELDQSQYNSKVYKQQNYNAINQYSANQLQVPDQGAAQNKLVSVWEGIDKQVGSNFDVESAGEAKRYAHEALARSVIEGHIQNENFNQAQSILNGKDGTSDKLPKLRDGLSPEQLVSLQNKIDSGKKARVAKLGHEYSQQSSDLMAAMSGGYKVPESAVWQQMAKNNSLVTDEASRNAIRRTNTEIAQQYAASSALNDLKQRPSSELVNGMQYIYDQTEKYMASARLKDPSLGSNDPYFQAADKERMMARSERLIAQELKSREDDGFSYVANNDPKVSALARMADTSSPESIRRMTDQAVIAQQQLGIQKIRVMPKQQSEQLGSELMAMSDPKLASMKINELQAMFGNNFHKAIHEMVDNKDLEPGLIMMATSESPKIREHIFDNTVKAKQYEKSFTDIRPEDKTSLKQEVASQLQPFSYSLVQNSDSRQMDPYLSSFHDQVLTQSYKLAGQTKYKNAPVSTIVKDAMDIMSEYTAVEYAGSHVSMPATSGGIPNDEGQLKKFMKASLNNSDAIAKINPIMPPKFEQTYAKEHAGAQDIPALARREWNAQVAGNSMWVQSDDMDGIKLIYKTPNDGPPIDLLDQSGNPIIFSFRDITSNLAMERITTPKPDQNPVGPPAPPEYQNSALAKDKK